MDHWQDVIAAALILVASVYLARRSWRRGGNAACHTCLGCPSGLRLKDKQGGSAPVAAPCPTRKSSEE